MYTGYNRPKEEYFMPSAHDDKIQTHFWLSDEVIRALKVYQHAHQLNTQTQAAEQVLRQALGLEPSQR